MNELDRTKFKKLQLKVKNLEEKDIAKDALIRELQTSFAWLKKEVQSGMADVMERFLKDNVEIDIVESKSTDDLLRELVNK